MLCFTDLDLLGNYHFSTPITNGAPVVGAYGHTSVYDTSRHVIYVHGGYKSKSRTKYELSGDLYAYRPKTRTWYALPTNIKLMLSFYE